MPTHDPTRRRQALRKGRERGCSIYISAEDLGLAGFSADEPPPYYRVWPGKPRPGKNTARVMVQLYREAS